MLQELSLIKEQLFDAPTEVKESFNEIVKYFDNQTYGVIKSAPNKRWKVVKDNSMEFSQAYYKSTSGLTREDAIRKAENLNSGKNLSENSNSNSKKVWIEKSEFGYTIYVKKGNQDPYEHATVSTKAEADKIKESLS